MHYVIKTTHRTIGGVKDKPELFQRKFFFRKRAEKYFEKVCDRTSRDMNKYLGFTREVSKDNYKRFDVKFNLDDEEIKITSEVFLFVPLVSVLRRSHQTGRTAICLCRPGNKPSQLECGHKESSELNDFEKAAIDYKYGGHDPSLFDPGYFDTARKEAAELLTLAREQFVKDGYVIEKKAFHDAIEKVDQEVKKEVSDTIDLSNFEYAMLRYVQEGINAKDDEELIELTKKYSKELHKYV